MKKGYVFLLCLTGMFTTAWSQQKLEKTLLWKISGKGFSRPSYLFGSIHLSDDRVFNLGDSIYKAIEQTDGLAIEFNPDEIGAYMMKDVFTGSETTAKKIIDILPKEVFAEYTSALEKKIGKPAKDITTADILNAKNKWVSNYMTEGSMSSFMDAWLYQLARKQGKWLGGIEDITDYEEAEDGSFGVSNIKELLYGDNKEELNNTINNMIRIYLRQDIDSIELSMRTPDSSGLEKSMVRRNLKMARRIDSLMQLRTMFFTVGSAHLSGEYGLIPLLRKKGFTVEPVYSSAYIPANSYKVKEKPILWTEVKHKNYRFLNQGNPAFMKVYNIMDMHFYFDIAEFAAYTIFSIPINFLNVNKDSLLNQMRDNIFAQYGEPTEESFSRNGYSGKDYSIDLEDQYMRIQMIPHENILLMAMINGPDPAKISHENVSKFFNSIEIYPSVKSDTDSISFVIHNNKNTGISFTSPINLEYSKTLSDRSTNKVWKGSVYGGADQSSGAYVFYYLSEAQPGYYVKRNEDVETEWFTALKTEYSNLTMKDSVLNGIKIKLFQGDRNQLPNQRLRAISTIQFGKRHMIATIASPDILKSARIDTIFKSFVFTTPTPANWKVQNAADGSFSALAPSTFNVDSDPDMPENVFHAYDSTTSFSIVVLRDTLSPYQWFESDSSIWQTFKPGIDSSSAIVKEHPVISDKGVAHEWLIQIAGSEKQIRTRYLINGNLLYKILVCADSGYLKTPNVERSLNSFSFATNADQKWIYNSKIGQLFKDIEDGDIKIRSAAYSFYLIILLQKRIALF